MQQAFIYDAIRSPRARARPGGGLHDIHPFDLLHALYSALEERVGLDPAVIAEVILGCVTQVGEQAGNIAKLGAVCQLALNSIGPHCVPILLLGA